MSFMDKIIQNPKLSDTLFNYVSDGNFFLIFKSKGIIWYPDLNLMFIFKVVKADSFFNFFSPPDVSEVFIL